MARELNKAEQKAVDRLDRALAGIPDSLALHFNESGFHIFDRGVYANQSIDRSAVWMDEASSDHRSIACRYDTGAI